MIRIWNCSDRPDWYLDLNGDGYLGELIVEFGLFGDIPVVGDFDGNGRDDLAVVRYNPQRGGLDWHIDLAGDGYMPEMIAHFGLLGDLPIPGDWNGDGNWAYYAPRPSAADAFFGRHGAGEGEEADELFDWLAWSADRQISGLAGIQE